MHSSVNFPSVGRHSPSLPGTCLTSGLAGAAASVWTTRSQEESHEEREHLWDQNGSGENYGTEENKAEVCHKISPKLDAVARLVTTNSVGAYICIDHHCRRLQRDLPIRGKPCPAHLGVNGAPRNKCSGRRRCQTCRGQCLSHGNRWGCSPPGTQAFRRAELYDCLDTKTPQVLTCSPFQGKNGKNLAQTHMKNTHTHTFKE